MIVKRAAQVAIDALELRANWYIIRGYEVPADIEGAIAKMREIEANSDRVTDALEAD